MVITRKQSGEVSVAATSCLGLPSVAPNMEAAWADGVGSWSGRSPDSISFGDCASAMRNEPTFMSVPSSGLHCDLLEVSERLEISFSFAALAALAPIHEDPGTEEQRANGSAY